MKKVILAIIAISVLATGAIFVVAQKRGTSDGGPGFGQKRGHRIGMALRGLDLTNEQKAKVKEIIEANKAAFEPTMQALMENRSKLHDLSKDGTFDQAQVEVLAKEQGDLIAKTIMQKESVKAQIFAILSDEQKAKAAEMRTKFEDRMKANKGFGGNHNGSEL